MNYTYNETNRTYELDDENGTIVISEEDFLDNYVICYDCEEAFPASECTYCESNGEMYCDSCLESNGIHECDHCGNYFFEHDGVFAADNGSFYCGNCADDVLDSCERCGARFYHDDNIFYNEDDDAYYCSECYDAVSEENVIKSYHTFKNKNDYTFFKTDKEEKNPLYLGFELEVDNGDDANECASALKTIFGDFCRYEHDGSLDSGFEIISQPATMAYHLSMEEKYKQAFERISQYGFKSHDTSTCGLHVHLSKSYFANVDNATSKLLFLFSRYWNELVNFSRRTPSQLRWCAQYQNKVSEVIKLAKEKKICRYFALNLTNEHTIEIRLWRGTLNYDSFTACLLFSARLAELAKTPIIELNNMTWNDILGDDPRILSYRKKRQNASGNYYERGEN